MIGVIPTVGGSSTAERLRGLALGGLCPRLAECEAGYPESAKIEHQRLRTGKPPNSMINSMDWLE